MHALNSWYGLEFNERHKRTGHLIGARFWSSRKPEIEQVLAAYRYVARNAEEAGMCEFAEDWTWSSYGTSLGGEIRFPFVDATLVLSQFGSSPAAAIAALRAYVARD